MYVSVSIRRDKHSKILHIGLNLCYYGGIKQTTSYLIGHSYSTVTLKELSTRATSIKHYMHSSQEEHKDEEGT